MLETYIEWEIRQVLAGNQTVVETAKKIIDMVLDDYDPPPKVKAVPMPGHHNWVLRYSENPEDPMNPGLINGWFCQFCNEHKAPSEKLSLAMMAGGVCMVQPPASDGCLKNPAITTTQTFKLGELRHGEGSTPDKENSDVPGLQSEQARGSVD